MHQFYSQDATLPTGFSTTALTVMRSFTLIASMQTSHTFFTASSYREIPSRKIKVSFLQAYWQMLRVRCWSSPTHSLQVSSYSSAEVPKPLCDRLPFLPCEWPLLCTKLFQPGWKLCFTHDPQSASHYCGSISSWDKSIPRRKPPNSAVPAGHHN